MKVTIEFKIDKIALQLAIRQLYVYHGEFECINDDLIIEVIKARAMELGTRNLSDSLSWESKKIKLFGRGDAFDDKVDELVIKFKHLVGQ